MEVARNVSVISPRTPIILITAQGSIDLNVQALAKGECDFIAKPFEIGVLANLVRRYIAARAEAAALSGRNDDQNRCALPQGDYYHEF